MDDSFTVMTYNCLYTEHANEPDQEPDEDEISTYEWELVERTES